MTPEQARAIAAPDSWPWPMSRDAESWVNRSLAPDGFQFCGNCHQGMDCGIKRRCGLHEAVARSHFMNKSDALGHAPDAKPAEPVEEHTRQFDSAKHREFMRGLG